VPKPPESEASGCTDAAAAKGIDFLQNGSGDFVAAAKDRDVVSTGTAPACHGSEDQRAYGISRKCSYDTYNFRIFIPAIGPNDPRHGPAHSRPIDDGQSLDLNGGMR
jgi:hypothetical protein